MSNSSLASDILLNIKDDSPYHYIPSKGIAILFIVLYGVSTFMHAIQLSWYRAWWLLPTVCLCGTLEILGWSGRLWSHFSPYLDTPFQIQITCTIMAPTPLLAANFVIFGRIIKRLGVSFSRLGAKWYTIIFCTCDVVSLVVQGVGGGLAASADTLDGANRGANIMLGGIAFQLLVMILFTSCLIEFFYRYQYNLPFLRDGPGIEEKPRNTANLDKFTPKLKIMTAALGFSTLFLFIRAIYRTVELSGGWRGPIITNELFFNVLDGAMVVLAIYTINFIHPGLFLSEEDNAAFPRSDTNVYT